MDKSRCPAMPNLEKGIVTTSQEEVVVEESLVERFRFVLYACAIVSAVICSPFLLFLSPFSRFGIFGINPVILALAIVFSCAYHWRRQSKKAKILSNVGRIFFWTIIVVQVIIVILFILAIMGMQPWE
jgi:hypothetical protein